ncbi:SusC/RagA family TonB-linked outer membrane protein [Niabella yanshanensis]|nr:SusC/RagA family TonB-linked outer membrane protein [Niabella yanshanensis]
MYKSFKPVLTVAMTLLLFATGSAQTTDSLNQKKVPVALEERVVTGVVRDAATRWGINGARLQVQGFSATIADSVGQYTIKVPAPTAIILVEADGYDPQVVSVKHRDQIEVVLLSRSTKSFNETMVTPTGRLVRKFITSNAEQVMAKGWQQPMETVDAMLQGEVAGLNSIRRSGGQGAGANLFLNGINSLYATNRPLIIVDGMPFEANDYGQSLVANNYTNPLSIIDVKDIDRITVLKDAAGIYGAKGSNGTIIITTVSAEGRQATQIDAGVFASFNVAPQNLPLLNVSDYRSHLSRMLATSGMTAEEIAAQPFMVDNVSSPDYYKYHNNTDWQRKVFNNSMNQNGYVRITGGDNIATYGLTVGYLKNTGIIKNTELERYHTRFNADFNFTEKLTGKVNLSFSYNEQNLKDQGIADKTGPLFNALVKSPFLADRERAADGTESPNLEAVDILGLSNPVVLTDLLQASNKYYRFFGSYGFKFEINKYMAASTLIGIQFDKVRETFFVPSEGVVRDTLWNAVANNRMGSQVKQLFSLFNDTKLEYNRNFNYNHSVTARLGIRYQNNRANQISVTTANSATDDLVSVQNGLAALRLVTGDMGEWNWMNAYLGADYGFKNKIFLSLNMAMDGSSRFGVKAANGLSIAGRQFPLFPSLGAAWLLSSEKFMSASDINLLKLRASYGIAGNDDIGNYTGLFLYTGQNLLGAQGFVRKGIANPSLQWETVHKLNGGVDLAFWNERVTFSLDAFSNRTTNMLVYRPLQSPAGFSTVLTNDGELKNNGVEGSFNVRVVNTKDVKWDFGANIATYKNKIVSVPGGEIFTEFAGATIRTAAGQPANQFYGYQTNGIFSSNAEATSAGLSMVNEKGGTTAFKGGDVRFVDMNGDKLIDENDRTVIGDANPDFFGGISNRLIYRGFELSALITYSVGSEVFNYLRYRLESQSGPENQLQSVLNSWRTDGQQTNMPRANWGDPMGNNRFSDRWIEDGSYLRLRSLNLTYNFKMKPGAPFKSIAVSATGNNLFTVTKYLGYDPEFSPFPSPLAQGIDTGMDPVFKNVVLGVRLGL